jgi:hypothetical protein
VPLIVNNESRGRFYYYQTSSNYKIPAFMISHPSSSQFDYSWYGFIQEALRKIS